MKRILFLSLLILSLLSASDVGQTDIEVFGFGKSYHTNREVDYNETNPGLALGLAYHYDKNTDLTLAGGFYKDSFYDHATFAMFGARAFVLGDRNSAYSAVGVYGGHIDGSGFHGLGFMPTLIFGYDKISIGLIGMPPSSNQTRHKEGSTAAKDNRTAPGGFIGAYLKITVFTF